MGNNSIIINNRNLNENNEFVHIFDFTRKGGWTGIIYDNEHINLSKRQSINGLRIGQKIEATLEFVYEDNSVVAKIKDFKSVRPLKLVKFESNKKRIIHKYSLPYLYKEFITTKHINDFNKFAFQIRKRFLPLNRNITDIDIEAIIDDVLVDIWFGKHTIEAHKIVHYINTIIHNKIKYLHNKKFGKYNHKEKEYVSLEEETTSSDVCDYIYDLVSIDEFYDFIKSKLSKQTNQDDILLFDFLIGRLSHNDLLQKYELNTIGAVKTKIHRSKARLVKNLIPYIVTNYHFFDDKIRHFVDNIIDKTTMTIKC